MYSFSISFCHSVRYAYILRTTDQRQWRLRVNSFATQSILNAVRSVQVPYVVTIRKRMRRRAGEGWRRRQGMVMEKQRERENERVGERDEGASSPCRGVLRRTIKPCRLRGGVMGSPKVNLTAYDLLYLPSSLPLLAARDFSLFSTLQRPSAFHPLFHEDLYLTISAVLSRRRPPTAGSCRYG